ncbi:MAG: PAS domain S-box protein [Methanoregula sp.]|nr:PAS domain S-box protein [Methanoregula sp.]
MEEGIKVLYVDDEPGLLEIARLFLEQSGNFQVSTSISAKNALDSPSIQSYDLILSDYLMPEMDGIVFLKEVRKRYGDLPFILFTGRGREEVVIDAINNGVDFYLQKGGDAQAQFAELAHKIRQAVLRKRAEHSRIKAELDLRESEEKYRSLVDLVPDAVLVHREGTVVYANPECVRLVGAAGPDDLLGRNMMPFIHPDDQPMAREHLRLMKEKGVTIPLAEERLFRLDGRPFTVEITARPVIYQGLPSVIVVFRDITDRKKKEDELRALYEQITAAEEELRGQYDELAKGERLVRESEEKYRNVIVNAPYGMHFYELDPHRGLVFSGANPGADRILGVSHDPFIGKTIEDAFPGLAGTEVPERYREVAESGSVWQTEQVNYDRGTISGAYSVTAFRTAPGAMAAMFVDITNRKQTEKLLEVSEDRSRRILEHAPLPLAFVRNDGVLTFVNDRFVRVFGYSAEDIPTLQAWWQKAYPDPDYRQRVRLQWEEAVRRSGEEHADIIPAKYRVTCKSGEERIFEVSGITLSDGFLATFIDQTERRSSPLPE